MTQDQNKKTLRHFQCRDYLWDIFEQMSRELECSPDYLINEAMRQYARSRNYGSRAGSSSPGIPRPSAPPPVPGHPLAGPPLAGPPHGGPPHAGHPHPGQSGMSSSAGGIPSIRQPPSRGPSAPPPPPPPNPYGHSPSASSPGYGGYGYGAPQPPPPSPYASQPGGGYGAVAPSYPGSAAPAMQHGHGAPAHGHAPPPAPNYGGGYGGNPPSAPPPLPGGGRAPGYGGMPSLFVIFNGQKIPVNKAEFVIGRGSKTADLPIKDGNISRRHAAIVFENGGFYMRDLGSTNGIEFSGQRIDNKPIQEGDVFQICDYELRFTYR